MDLRINLYLLDPDTKNLFLFRPSSFTSSQKSNTINLLLIETDTKQPHYVLIRDLGKAVPWVSPSNSKLRKRRFACENCLFLFYSPKSLANHEKICINNDGAAQSVKLCKPGEIAKFDRGERCLKRPFFGILDFESREKTPYSGKKNTATMDVIKELEPISYSLIFVDRDNKIVFHRSEASDTECEKLFMNAVEEASTFLDSKLSTDIPYGKPSDPRIRQMKREASSCFLCYKPFRYTEREESFCFSKFKSYKEEQLEGWRTAKAAAEDGAETAEGEGKSQNRKPKGLSKGFTTSMNTKKLALDECRVIGNDKSYCAYALIKIV